MMPTYVSSATKGSEIPEVPAIILSAPTTKANDLLLAVFTVTGTRSAALSAPAGWMPIGAPYISTSFWNMGFAFYKIASKKEPKSYTFKVEGYILGFVAGVTAYRGVDKAEPIALHAWWGAEQVPLSSTIPHALATYFATADWPEPITGPTPARSRWAVTSSDNCGCFGDAELVDGMAPMVSIELGPPGSNAGSPSLTAILRPSSK